MELSEQEVKFLKRLIFFFRLNLKLFNVFDLKMWDDDSKSVFLGELDEFESKLNSYVHSSDKNKESY